MTPMTATLTGSLGIRAGLNRDSITLDLSAIPEDALTVAIKGDNGMGKSTLLNLALSPYREPPQIAGTVYDQFGETGSRELIWSHAGETYRTQIVYKTGKAKTQRAYLHVRKGDEWAAVTLPDHTVSDGKASTYDACLDHILGPKELWYLSAFRAQNAPKLAEYDNPKELMRALLDLDQPAALADQARDVARELKRHYETLRAQTAALDGHPARIAQLEAQITALSAGHAARVQAKLDAIDGAARAKAELERAMSGDLDRQRLIDQRARVEQRLIEAKQDADVRLSAARQARADTESRLAKARADATARVGAIEMDIASARARLARAEATLGQRAAIDAAAADVARLSAAIDAAEQDERVLTEEIAALRSVEAKVHALEVQRNAVASEGKVIAARIAELNARAGFVAVVPCRGEGEYAACPALQEALQAKAKATEAEAQAKDKRDRWHTLTSDIKTAQDIAAPLPTKSAQYAEARTRIESMRISLRTAQAHAAQAAALALAEQQREEATGAVADLTARLDTEHAQSAASIAHLEAECAAATTAEADVAEAAQAAVQAIAAEVAALPEPGTDQAVTLARQAVATAETAVSAAMQAIETATATKTQHQAEIGHLRTALDAAAATSAQARALEAEIADWTLLGFGLRGVIDLSIEDAGPGIAALANQLLTDAYGPRFTVRIVTQREQQNGVVRECFDISVIDAETGIESSIIHKSGGESVWLDKALTDAVGLYHQESSGRRYETLFADEAEDGLTEERKHQFYRMDRAALAMGGYQRKFFVSHNPDAWALADHVIDLADYRTAA